MIKKSILRDRHKLLSSKFYFEHLMKSDNPSKTYYIDEFIDCLKSALQRARSDSTFQSLDESTVKFKGRSALKQFLPLKPIKRGIKLMPL